MAGRELAAHIEAELARGGGLRDVLADEFVSERLAERPYLLDDLLADQLLIEQVQRHDRTLDFDQLERLLSPDAAVGETAEAR